ncbi:MAG: hypothetical protein DHS20C14_20720 [Phycisphaeraceae bacterium]|nr:MAG: hypothetical protein DHS20C14_20720 [Phycisphaeraceae bacterium]
MTNWNALEAIRKAQDEPNDERRGAPRFGCKETMCGKGAVVDLSRTGLRVRTSTKPPRADQTIGLELKGDDGKTRVGAQIVWSRPAGKRQYDIGFRLSEPAQAGPAGLFKHAWNPECSDFVSAKRR